MCSSSCRTQDHKNWGECVRSKGLQIADVDAHVANGSIKRQINEYVSCRKEGMQPDGIGDSHVKHARAMTAATGVPYRADKD